jgi:hypothetical protein
MAQEISGPPNQEKLATLKDAAAALGIPAFKMVRAARAGFFLLTHFSMHENWFGSQK